MNKKKVLIAYERKETAAEAVRFLEKSEYEVFSTASGTAAQEIAASHCPDIILLGISLEELDGISVLKSIRTWSDVPVIMLSSARNEMNMLEALDSGADDYIRTPCSTAQLVSRMRVAQRHYQRCGRLMGSADGYNIGDMRIDCADQRVYIGDRDAGLTQNEYRIVALLAKHHGTTCPYRYILTQLWGPNSAGDNEILRVNMVKIRRKIGDNPEQPCFIHTIPRVGYRMGKEKSCGMR